ncbi:MAG: Ig-like domain-containing protein, partial [Lachnospiraceae bacterium]|nr:Ig-like domain-containing protein [Lachnospiraceae bacterium]
MKSTFFKKGVLKRGLATVMTAAMLAVEGLGAPGLAGVLTVQAAETTVDDASANVAFAADAETELKVGDEKVYTLDVTEYDASTNAIKFKSFDVASSNEEVATVVASETEKKVTVTAVAAGEATIAVTAKFDASENRVVEKTATLNVKVTEAEAEEETVVAEDSEIVVDVTEGIAVTADSKSARIATVAFNNFTDADVA